MRIRGNKIGFPLEYFQLTMIPVNINNPNIISVILPPGGFFLNFFLVLKSTNNFLGFKIFEPHFLQTSGSGNGTFRKTVYLCHRTSYIRKIHAEREI